MANGAVIGSGDGAGGFPGTALHPTPPYACTMLISGLFWGGCSGVPSGRVKNPSSLLAIAVPLITPS